MTAGEERLRQRFKVLGQKPLTTRKVKDAEPIRGKELGENPESVSHTHRCSCGHWCANRPNDAMAEKARNGSEEMAEQKSGPIEKSHALRLYIGWDHDDHIIANKVHIDGFGNS